MQMRELGAGGPKVAEIALGCMSFAGFYGATTEEESMATLARTQEHGITHLDTARVYGAGLSETIIGKYIKANPGHNFVIATKGGMVRSPDGHRYFDNSPLALQEHLDGSLARLGVDHVPLYYVHRRDQARPIEDVMETLLRFKDAGKIGGIGFSEIAPSSLRRAAKIGPVMAVQSEYSLWTRMPELGMIDACAEVGAAFVAFSPLGRGIFSDVAPDPAEFLPVDIRKGNPRFTGENYAANLEYVAKFRAVAQEAGTSPAALAIAWTLDQAPHIIPIPGTRSVAHLDQFVGAASVTMTPELRAKIAEALPIGFAHGDRYTAGTVGVERYC